MKPSISKHTFLLILLIASIFGFLVFLKTNSTKIPSTVSLNAINQNANVNTYTSQNLKISFKYPQNWYIEDEHPFLLVSNFKSSLHKNVKLQSNQIEVLISNFNGCHKTIEENLIDPACGEGGLTVAKNKIMSKDVRQTPGGTFYKYMVQTPNNQFTYYLLEKEGRVLQIEKKPDPSQFGKEFEDIVNSIRFID